MILGSRSLFSWGFVHSASAEGIFLTNPVDCKTKGGVFCDTDKWVTEEIRSIHSLLAGRSHATTNRLQVLFHSRVATVHG